MIQALSQYVDIKDNNIQSAIKELKMLELQVSQEEILSLIEQTFAPQKTNSITNQSFQIQVGNQCEISLIEDRYNKPLLCEYLEAQYETLVELINDISTLLKSIINSLDDKRLVDNKTQLYKFQEESQKQILLLNSPLELNTLANTEDIYKCEFLQFIKDQKNLLTYQNQVQQLEQKMKEMKKIIFDKIEEQNNMSEAVVQKMELNIDNELKLLEKTIELKLIIKIENDLQAEVLKIEKCNLGNTEDQPERQFEDSQQQLEKQISQLFNQVCATFQELKEQKIKNNDLIYEQILHSVELQGQTLNKISQLQEANAHQFLDYLQNYPEVQQYFREDLIGTIKEQKEDYDFSQKFASQQLQNDCHEIDEFLKLFHGYNEMKETTDQLAENFNSEWGRQRQNLENIKQYLITLQKSI